MGFLLVLKAEIIQRLIIMRRYWFASILGILMGYGMLIGLIYAIIFKSEELREKMASFTENALGLIIGMFAFGILGLFTSGLQGMARTGELEQVCMSPYGLITNFLARSFVSALTSIFYFSIILYLVARHLGGELFPDPQPSDLPTTIVLLGLTYLNLIGFGFMTGGLVLVFKQVGQIATLVKLAFIAIAVAATDKVAEWPVVMKAIAHVMPVTDAAICLKQVIIDGRGVAVFGDGYFWLLLVNCGIWTFVGVACFRFLENYSRDKGTLGAY